MATNLSIQERITRARTNLVLDHPFFGTLLLNSKCRVTDSIPTAATDGDHILLNENFMMGLEYKHFSAVLVHEVLHLALEHIARFKDVFASDPQTINIAADIVVNGIIEDNGISLPKGAVKDKDLKHLSVREIYTILKREQQKNPNHLQDKYGVGEGSGVNECLQPQASSGGGGQDDEDGSEGGGSNSKGPEGEDGSGGNIPNDRKGTYWKDVLNKAAAIAKTKSYGLKGAGLNRIFEEFLDPTINWRDALYKYITDSKNDFVGYDRRFIYDGNYIDDLAGGEIKVLVFMDTSGSVDEQLLGEFMAELRFAINSLPKVSGEMWFFDTKLYPLGDVMEIMGNPKLKGGGGTDFKPVFKKVAQVAENDSTTQVLTIVFTDGYASYTNFHPAETPVLWCISPGGVDDSQLPFGDVVRILK